jgi:GNAT superfamily N-acetyltransferase
MELSVKPASLNDILPFRQSYRAEMNCQIIHDSLHTRKGWTDEFLFLIDAEALGYASIAVGGPWKDKPAIFEYYVSPEHRSRLFDLFDLLLRTTGVKLIDTQTNDLILTTMLHTFAETVATEAILFHDKLTTHLSPTGALFRRATPEDATQISASELDPDAKWIVEIDSQVAAAGDILFHYNPPYGDIYMKVAEPFRRRGLGSFLVQELKKVCYQQDKIPAARCNPKNIASRKTLQKAGLVPCGNLLNGKIA